MATITPRADIGFALATRLIAQRGKRISRQSLLALFWPRSPAPTAAHALSEALHKLRRKGLPVCGDDTACVWVEREVVSTDIDRLSSHAPHTLLDRDLTILPGYSPTATPVFHDWLDDWRAELRLDLVAALLKATERADDEGDARTTIGLTEQLLKLDPTNEAALSAAAEALESLRVAARAGIAVPPDVATVRERAARTRWSVPTDGFPAARDTILVGRDADVRIGTNVLEAACRRRGGALYLSGAAGIGKSRLVRALTCIAQDHSMAVAAVACQQSDPFRPLSALVDIVPKLRLLPGAAGAAPALAEYLDRLTNHSANDYAPHVDAREVEHTFSCIRHAVFDLLEAVADEQPLVAVIENMQWLDPASLLLLRELSAWATTRSVAFLFTSREQWMLSECGEPTTALRLHNLQPLSNDAVAEHAMHYASAIGRTPPAEMLQRCIAASEGNPYLLEELLNHWVATDEQFATPPSLTALLEARIERLSPTALMLLQTCAVLGRNSTLARLEQVLEHAPHELFGALEDLGTAGMLTTERDDDGSGRSRILCRHDVLAQAALGRLFPASVELLHRRAGLVLEAELGAPNSASLLWDCATHWHAAGNSVRAVELGRACVGHLLEIGLATEAVEGCRRTLAFCTHAADRIEVLTTLATALHLTRSWSDLFSVVGDIRGEQSALGHTPAPHDDLELLVLDADWHAHRDWDATLRQVRQCVSAEQASAAHRVRAGVMALKLATNLGQIDTMHSVRTDLIAALDDPSVPDADRLTFEMIFQAMCGSARPCVRAAQQLLTSLGDEIPEPRRLCIALNCASALARAGELKEALHTYDSAFARAQELSASGIARETCTRAASTCLDIDDIATAEIWTRRNLALSGSSPEAFHTPFLRYALARIELHNGNATAADHLLFNDGKPLWEDPVDLFRDAVLAAKIRIELALGDHSARVASLVEQLAPLNERMRAIGWQDFETSSLFCGLRSLGRLAEADRMLADYVKRTRRDPLPLSGEIATEIARINASATESERDGA